MIIFKPLLYHLFYDNQIISILIILERTQFSDDVQTSHSSLATWRFRITLMHVQYEKKVINLRNVSSLGSMRILMQSMPCITPHSMAIRHINDDVEMTAVITQRNCRQHCGAELSLLAAELSDLQGRCLALSIVEMY